MILATTDLRNNVFKQNNANVFFQQEYADFVKSTGKFFYYCYSDKYVIPVSITKKTFFKYARLEAEPYNYNSSVEEDETSFLDDVFEYLKGKGIQWLMPSPASAFFMEVPSKAVKIPFGSHVIDLCQGEEALFKNLHSKHRNVIKKAEKDGIRIEKGHSDTLIRDFVHMNIETWGRSNQKTDGYNYWKNMIDSMPESSIVYIAYDGKVPQSGAIFFYNLQMSYYMYGVNKNNPHTGAGNLLQWQAILDMKTKGVKKYSFVGCRINEDEKSKYHGIQRFKERFGGELIKGYMFKCIFDKRMRQLFEMSYSIMSLLRTGRYKKIQDIIDQELYKWE